MTILKNHYSITMALSIANREKAGQHGTRI